MRIISYTGYILHTDRVDHYYLSDEGSNRVSFIAHTLSGEEISLGTWDKNDIGKIIDYFTEAEDNSAKEFGFERTLQDCEKTNGIFKLSRSPEQIPQDSIDVCKAFVTSVPAQGN